MNVFALLDVTNLKQTQNHSLEFPCVQISWMLQADIYLVCEGLSDQYQVFLQVDAAQEAEILQARQTADSREVADS